MAVSQVDAEWRSRHIAMIHNVSFTECKCLCVYWKSLPLFLPRVMMDRRFGAPTCSDSRALEHVHSKLRDAPAAILT